GAEGTENRRHLHSRVSRANHQHRWRDRSQTPGIVMGTGQLEAWDRETPAHAARANDDLLSLQPESAVGLDGMRVDEVGSPRMLMHGHSARINRLAQERMCTHVVDDLTHTRKRRRIIHHRIAHRAAVLTKRVRPANHPSRVCQDSHRNWSVIRSHATELAAGDDCSARAKFRSTQGCEHTSRSGPDYEDVCHLYSPRIDFFAFSAAFNAVRP